MRTAGGGCVLLLFLSLVEFLSLSPLCDVVYYAGTEGLLKRWVWRKDARFLSTAAARTPHWKRFTASEDSGFALSRTSSLAGPQNVLFDAFLDCTWRYAGYGSRASRINLLF